MVKINGMTGYVAILHQVRRRLWVEVGLLSASLVVLLLTCISDQWIEMLTGFDPDERAAYQNTE